MIYAFEARLAAGELMRPPERDARLDEIAREARRLGLERIARRAEKIRGESRISPRIASSSLLPQALAGGGGGGGFGMKILRRGPAARRPGGGGGGGGFGMKISRQVGRASFAEEAAAHGAGMARHNERMNAASSQDEPESISLRVVNITSLPSVERVFSSSFSFAIESGFEKLNIAAGVPGRLPGEIDRSEGR